MNICDGFSFVNILNLFLVLCIFHCFFTKVFLLLTLFWFYARSFLFFILSNKIFSFKKETSSILSLLHPLTPTHTTPNCWVLVKTGSEWGMSYFHKYYIHIQVTHLSVSSSRGIWKHDTILYCYADEKKFCITEYLGLFIIFKKVDQVE